MRRDTEKSDQGVCAHVDPGDGVGESLLFPHASVTGIRQNHNDVTHSRDADNDGGATDAARRSSLPPYVFAHMEDELRVHGEAWRGRYVVRVSTPHAPAFEKIVRRESQGS